MDQAPCFRVVERSYQKVEGTEEGNQVANQENKGISIQEMVLKCFKILDSLCRTRIPLIGYLKQYPKIYHNYEVLFEI